MCFGGPFCVFDLNLVCLLDLECRVTWSTAPAEFVVVVVDVAVVVSVAVEAVVEMGRSAPASVCPVKRVLQVVSLD